MATPSFYFLEKLCPTMPNDYPVFGTVSQHRVDVCQGFVVVHILLYTGFDALSLQAMSGSGSGGLLGDVDEVTNLNMSTKSDEGEDEDIDIGGGERFTGGDDEKDEKDYFNVPPSVARSQRFKGIAKNRKTGEVEVTVKLPSR